MKKVLFIALSAALTLVACQKQDTVRSAQPGEVRFTTNIQTYTVKATDTAFENNDKVGIFAGAPISKNNVEAVVSGTSLLPVTPIKWVEGNNSVVKFFAYYPYDAAATASYNFAVQSNQSALDFYKKSDLMLASASSAPVETAVALPFSHVLSKVVIGLTNNVPETTVTKVEFEGVALSAKVNLETGALSELATELGTITANPVSATSYQLITMPQTASPKIRVTLSNGKAYLFELASAFTFKAGKKATAALTLNPLQEAGSVEFTLEVNDWDTDTDALGFGDPSVEDAEEGWAVMGLGGDWENGVAMTEDEYHNWSADITYAEGDEFKLKLGDTWVGMQPTWSYYGLGDFGNDTNYLQEGDEAINIVLQAAGEYHLFFAPDTKWFVVTKKGGDEPTPNPETVKLTVNVYNGAGWENVKLYTWLDEAKPCGEWPGAAPTATDVVVNEVTYKSFVITECPKGAVNYILNNGATAQTADMNFGEITADKTVYLNLRADLSVAVIEDPTTFDPTTAPAPEVIWAMVGVASDWTTEHAMTQDATDPNLWTITITFGAEAAEKDGFKFKVKGDTSWAKQFGVDPEAATNVFEITEADQEITLVADNGGSKNIVVTPFANRYTFKLYVDGENKGKLLVTKL